MHLILLEKMILEMSKTDLTIDELKAELGLDKFTTIYQVLEVVLSMAKLDDERTSHTGA